MRSRRATRLNSCILTFDHGESAQTKVRTKVAQGKSFKSHHQLGCPLMLILDNSLQMSQVPQVRKSQKSTHTKHGSTRFMNDAFSDKHSCFACLPLNEIHGVIKADVPLVRNLSQVGLAISKARFTRGPIGHWRYAHQRFDEVHECTLALQQFYFCRWDCRSVECHKENDYKMVKEDVMK